MANTLQNLPQSQLWTYGSKLQLADDYSPKDSLHNHSLTTLINKGLNGGIIGQIYGPRSSGRSSLCHRFLRQSTRRGQACAVIDLYDSFHPHSAAAAGVCLNRLVWIRCRGNAEHAMRVADLLLHGGGFGVVLLDLCEASPRVFNRIPLSYWYRFQRAIKCTPTTLLVCAGSPIASSCFSVSLELKLKAAHWTGTAPFLLLRGLETEGTPHKAMPVRPEPLFFQTVA